MKNRLFVCGDTHMSHDIQKINTRNFPEQKTLSKNDVLIQLGDFGGIWYPLGMNKEQTYWLEWVARKKFTTAVVLGNHENYNEIETLPWCEMWGNEVQFWESSAGDRIYFFKRGGIYTINGRKILTVGGAHSIDKSNRTKDVSWWVQEDISYKETEDCFNELDSKGYDLDYVLTHTCPTSLVEKFIHITKYNVGKIKDTTSEFLEVLYERVTFKEWHFGHMHVDLIHKEILQDGSEDFFECHYNTPPKELL